MHVIALKFVLIISLQTLFNTVSHPLSALKIKHVQIKKIDSTTEFNTQTIVPPSSFSEVQAKGSSVSETRKSAVRTARSSSLEKPHLEIDPLRCAHIEHDTRTHDLEKTRSDSTHEDSWYVCR